MESISSHKINYGNTNIAKVFDPECSQRGPTSSAPSAVKVGDANPIECPVGSQVTTPPVGAGRSVFDWDKRGGATVASKGNRP